MSTATPKPQDNANQIKTVSKAPKVSKVKPLAVDKLFNKFRHYHPGDADKELAEYIRSSNYSAKQLNEPLDTTYNTVVILAANRDLSEIVKALVEKGADLNRKNIFGCNAVLWAAETGNKDLLEHLVNRGGRIHYAEDEKNLLATCIRTVSFTRLEEKIEAYKKMVDYLLERCQNFAEIDFYAQYLKKVPAQEFGPVYHYAQEKIKLYIEKHTLEKNIEQKAGKTTKNVKI